MLTNSENLGTVQRFVQSAAHRRLTRWTANPGSSNVAETARVLGQTPRLMWRRVSSVFLAMLAVLLFIGNPFSVDDSIVEAQVVGAQISFVSNTHHLPTSSIGATILSAIVGNEVDSLASPTAVSSTGDVGHQKSVPFTTGDNTGGYTLEEVVVPMWSTTTTYSPIVTLHADSAGNPAASALLTFTNASPLPSLNVMTRTNVSFTATGGYELESETKYYIVFKDAAGATDAQFYAATLTALDTQTAGTGVGSGWDIGNTALKRVGDTGTWTDTIDLPNNWTLRLDIKGKLGRALEPAVTIDTDTGTADVQTGTLMITEGMSGEYSVVLTTAPTSEVTVTPGPVTGLSISPNELTFTTTNWGTAQKFTVTATEDDDLKANDYTISHSVTGYGTVTDGGSVSVTVTDNDQPSVTVSPTALPVNEGQSAPYTVVLDFQPDDDVTVDVTLPSGTDLTISSNELTFTSANWDTAQRVTVTAAQDDDRANDMVTITHTVSGAEYGDDDQSTTADNVDVDSVVVTVNDDDIGITLSNTAITVAEGAFVDYEVSLGRQPSGTVTVTLALSAGSGVTLSGSALTFTQENWSTAQIVRVTATEDDDAFNNTGTITHTLSGSGLSGSANANVTVTDDESVDLEFTGTTEVSGVETLMVTENAEQTYTVNLTSQPYPSTADVTLTVTAPAGSGVTLKTTGAPTGAASIELTFTSSNWDTPQNVTVVAADDDDSSDAMVSLTHTAAGADYAGETLPSVTANVADDDTPGLEFSRNAFTVIEKDVDVTDTYTVKLTTRPSATVTVTLTQPSNTDVTVDTDTGTTGDQTSLTFTALTWNTPQTVTVTVREDDDAGNEDVTITHTASGGDYVSVTGTVTVNIDDDETAAISTVTTINVNEGQNGLFPVRLRTPPTSDVTITIELITTDSDVTVTTGSLTFTSSDWSTFRNFVVAVGHDDDGEPDTVTLRQTASQTGGSREYDQITVTTVATIDDDDPKMVIVTAPTDPLQLDEDPNSADNSVEYQVRLSTQPTGNVRISAGLPLSGMDLRVDRALTFTRDNWDTDQTFTVTAVSDDDAVDDRTFIQHQVTGYGSGVPRSQINVRIADDDEAGYIIVPTDVTVTEGDTTDPTTSQYTIRLATQGAHPTSALPRNAMVTIESNNDDVTISPSSFTFGQTNWNVPVTITVRANNDADAAPEMATLTHSVTTGFSDYVDVAPATVEVTVEEDDVPEIVLSGTSVSAGVHSIDVEEAATATTFGVQLSHVPTGEVTVELTSDSTEVTITPDEVTITASNWNMAQDVQVTAANDDDARDDEAEITLRASMDGGSNEYLNVENSVSVNIDDNDTQRVVADPTTLRIIEPDGTDEATATYTLTLSTLPVDADGNPDTVTVTITDPTNTDITADPATVTFTSSNWNTGEEVTVSVTHDADSTADRGTITHSAAGSDYASAPSDSVNVNVVDDEGLNVLISESSLEVNEESSSHYRISLSLAPTGTVTVVARSNNTEVTLGTTTTVADAASSVSLTFNASTYDTEQRVYVFAADDFDAAEDTAVISHSVSGAEYNNAQTPLPLDVTVAENDTLYIDVAPVTLDITEIIGGTGTGEYEVTLGAAPDGGNVTITMTVLGDSDVTVNPTPLTFSASDWSSSGPVTKTVTVNVAEDPDATGPETATISHAVTGSDYETAGETADPVTVTVTDVSVRGVTVTGGPLSFNEGGSDTYTVVLDTRPTGDVEVDIEDPSNDDLSASPDPLTFTAANWDTPQTVTVRAAADEDAVEDTGTIIHTVSGADYNGIPADEVDVTVSDLSVRSVEISDPVSSTIAENGTTTYTIRLGTQPTGTVTVTIATTNSDVDFSPSTSITFNADDWNEEKTVRIGAVRDNDAATDTATISHTVGGADYEGAGVSVRSFDITILDTDTPEISVGVEDVTVIEGHSAGYTVQLGTRPTGGTVTITITPPTNTDITVEPDQLTFNSNDWDSAKTVVVSAEHDDDTLPDFGTITHSATGADFGSAEDKTVRVNVTEDDMAGVIITPTSLTVGEDRTATYDVVLGTEPSGDVTITVNQPDNRDITVSPRTLTFTMMTWNEDQEVKVSATRDADALNDVAVITHTAAGHEYAGVTVPEVNVTVVEDGTAVRDTSSFLRSSSCDNTLQLTWNAPTADANNPIASFQIHWRSGDEQYDSSRLVALVADKTSYSLGPLTNGRSYSIRITGFNEASEPLWSREITAMPSDKACIAEVSFGNILADSTPVIVEVEDPEVGTRVNMRYRSLNPGVWSDVQSKVIEEGEDSVTFDIRGLRPDSNYEVQTWLGDRPTPPPAESAARETAEASVAQVIFTTGQAPEGATFSGGSRSGRILRIEPSITAVTVSPGDTVMLSVEVWGRQNLPDNGLADKAPSDGRPTFTWISNGGGIFAEGRVRSEWSNGEADDRTVFFTAPSTAGTLIVEANVDGASDCLAAQENETSNDQTARCRAQIDITIVRRTAIQPDVTAPVNPPGVIPATLTDADGVAYAVFTPVDGGSFLGDGYSFTAGAGAVADGEYIGVSMTPAGEASNVGMIWHRYTLGGLRYSIGVADAGGEPVSDYLLDSAATVCVPLPAELRGNVADIVLVAIDEADEITILSTSVKITPDGVAVCGKLSTAPSTVAVGRIGAPPDVVEPDQTGMDALEMLPDTGGKSVPSFWLMMIIAAGIIATTIGTIYVARARRTTSTAS